MRTTAEVEVDVPLDRAWGLGTRVGSRLTPRETAQGAA